MGFGEWPKIGENRAATRTNPRPRAGFDRGHRTRPGWHLLVAPLSLVRAGAERPISTPRKSTPEAPTAMRIIMDDRYGTAPEFLRRLARRGFDIRAAAWLTPNDGDESFDQVDLYVGSATVAEKGAAAAYREVSLLLREMPETLLTVSDVKLVGPSDPVALDLAEIYGRYRSPLPTRILNRAFGNVSVREAYLYPRAIRRPRPGPDGPRGFASGFGPPDESRSGPPSTGARFASRRQFVRRRAGVPPTRPPPDARGPILRRGRIGTPDDRARRDRHGRPTERPRRSSITSPSHGDSP